jgi:anti-sigma B factor antagonist
MPQGVAEITRKSGYIVTRSTIFFSKRDVIDFMVVHNSKERAAMEEMFKSERKGHVTVLSTSESLEANTAIRLKDVMKKLGSENGLKLVIDMKKIESIDSAGCGALVASLRTVLANDGEMKIAAPNRKVLAVLKLTRLDNVFEIHDDLDGAIDSFLRPPM